MLIEKKSKEAIEKMKFLAEKERILCSPIAKKEYNFEFVAENGREQVKIQVYFGKKGVKTVLQGDLKSGLYKNLSSLILEEPKLDFAETPLNEPDEYIGTDECGKGDFFGPLVVAAVYVNAKRKKMLSEAGVRDSKDLSDPQIKILAVKIKKIVSADFEIVRINPRKYNELYEQFLNLNKLLNWAHSKGIDNLLDNTGCKYVITDKFSKKELDVVSLSKHSDVEFVQETKAEKYTGVAAASILARDSFVSWFEENQRKGLNLPKGSSIETEKFAKNLLKKIGEDKLTDLAKLHFKTFKKISSD